MFHLFQLPVKLSVYFVCCGNVSPVVFGEVATGAIVDDEGEVIRQYCEKFGECRDGTDAGVGRCFAKLGIMASYGMHV